MMQAVEFTLKKVFPWLASSESDFGLFLLYNAYIPNWSFCKREPCVRAVPTHDTVTALPLGWLLQYFCLSQAAPEPPMISGVTLLQVHQKPGNVPVFLLLQ